jgi:hypothetical protein
MKSPGQLLFEAYVAVVYYGWTLGDGQILFQWGDLYPRQQETWELMAKLYAEALSKAEGGK